MDCFGVVAPGACPSVLDYLILLLLHLLKLDCGWSMIWHAIPLPGNQVWPFRQTTTKCNHPARQQTSRGACAGPSGRVGLDTGCTAYAPDGFPPHAANCQTLSSIPIVSICGSVQVSRQNYAAASERLGGKSR